MIKHVVCFKLKNDSIELRKKTKDILLSMQGRVPMLLDLKVGVDFLSSTRSYDIILETYFNNKEDLENYQNEDGSVTVPEVLRPYMGVDMIK